MDIGVKKFRDKRLDLIKSHTVDIFAGQRKLDLMKAKGLGIEHMNLGLNRFKKHDLHGQTPVTGRFSGLGKRGVSLLGGSVRDQHIEKPKQDLEDEKTGYEKKIERIKEAFKRKT